MRPDLESEAIALAFGATVRALRQEAGMSLNELARRAGVDPAYIHRIEARGTRRPPLPRRPVVVAIAGPGLQYASDRPVVGPGWPHAGSVAGAWRLGQHAGQRGRATG